MAEGKFISHLQAHTPLVEAARRVLAVRLGVVGDRLGPALQEAGPEHIHQLRVGTRRAGAGLRIFSLCLPHKEVLKLRQKLQRLRRAAGAARDWDVFFATAATRIVKVAPQQRPGLDFLLGYSRGQRAAAQLALREALADPKKDLERLRAEIVAAVRPPEKGAHLGRLGDLAKPTLTHLLRALEQAAGQDLGQYEHLHCVRILGKRLRYAMEVFESCYADPFRAEYYLAVEEMQDILGHANDSYLAGCRLTSLAEQLQKSRPKLWQRWQAGIQGLLRFHQRRLPQQRRQFLQWWQRWQQSGAERAFARLLTT